MDRVRLDRFIGQRLAALPLAEPVFVSPSASVKSAVEQMRQVGTSCVLTMADERLTGIFTERDVLTKCMEDGFDWEQPLEAKVLTRDPQSLPPGATVSEAIAVMHRDHYRTLPVCQEGRVLGVLRAGDIVKHLVETYPEDVLNLPPRPHQVMEKREGG